MQGQQPQQPPQQKHNNQGGSGNNNNSNVNNGWIQVGNYGMWEHQQYGLIPVQIDKVKGKIVTISYPIDQPHNERQSQSAFGCTLKVCLYFVLFDVCFSH